MIRRFMGSALAWGALLGFPSSGQGQDLVWLGSEFQVNTYTTSNQDGSSTAIGPQGDFVVTWFSGGSSGSDHDSGSIQGQRYASDGTPMGAQFQVNSYTKDGQQEPSISMGPQGQFAVVWESFASSGSDSDGVSIQGRRYASNGTALGPDFQVNTDTAGSQAGPSVAVGPQSQFAVVWDAGRGTIQGQRYASDGTALASEFQVNTVFGAQSGRVAMGPQGQFVVVWESPGSSGSDTSDLSIQGRRYAADGTALGSEFQINSYTTEFQGSPSVAIGPQGHFVIIWSSVGSSSSDTDSSSIQGQLYAPEGTALGSQFQVNSYTTGAQERASIAMNPDGQFVVSWTDFGYSGSDKESGSIHAQRFALSIATPTPSSTATATATPTVTPTATATPTPLTLPGGGSASQQLIVTDRDRAVELVFRIVEPPVPGGCQVSVEVQPPVGSAVVFPMDTTEQEQSFAQPEAGLWALTVRSTQGCPSFSYYLAARVLPLVSPGSRLLLAMALGGTIVLLLHRRGPKVIEGMRS